MTTTTLLSTGLTELLADTVLFVDTNVFIGASRSDGLSLFLLEQKETNKCQIITVSSAVYEYTRGSKKLEDFNNRREFVGSLVNRVISVGRLLENDQNDVFSLVMSTLVSAKDSDYTDYLLATCLYQYSRLEKVYLMTADQRSMPKSIFNVVGNITSIDNAGNLQHYDFYEFNRENFVKITSTLST